MSAASLSAIDGVDAASAASGVVPAGRDLALAALAALVATAAAAATLLVDPSYFLTGDFMTYFRPVFYEIARLLVHGQFPLLTDRLWDGGALLQEYQFAVFNPVSLALYLAISQVGDPSAGAAVFSLAHIAILAAGVYALCRSMGCLPRHAFLAGAVAPLSDWIFFWGAVDWIPALVSLAWLVWAWTLLILSWRRKSFMPAAAVAVALTLLSGWPFADFALLISAAVAARVLFVGGVGPRWRQAVWPALALMSGGLMAMPAILPLAFYVAAAPRPFFVSGWEASLSSLLSAGMPLVQGHWAPFEDNLLIKIREPIVYAAWFAPLALAGANWRTFAGDRRIWLVLGSAAAFAALSMISHVGPLRWMFRLLPYYQLALIVAAAMALTQADDQRVTWKFDRLAVVIVAETWLAFTLNRDLALAYLCLAYGIGVLAWISVRFGGRRDARWTAMTLTVSLALFAVTVAMLATSDAPRYPAPWKQPAVTPIPVGADARGPERLYLTGQLSTPQDPGPAFWTIYRPRNLSLYFAGTSVTGYSPLLHEPYGEMQCWDRCDQVIDHLLAPVSPTGRDILDLMGVGEVDIQRPSDAARFSFAAGSGWTESVLPDGGRRFERPSSEGRVAWSSPRALGVTLKAGVTRLVVDARNDAAAPGMLVLSRAWYPGWRARLDRVPLRVEPLGGVLVAVDLPPKSRGRVDVWFWPQGLTAGLLLAAIGMLIAIFGQAVPRLPGRPLSFQIASRP